MPGINGDSRFFINHLGLRGDEFSDDQTYRILAIGGSTTECLYLDETEAWPHLLQEDLNARLEAERRIWVGNVGKSGHSTRHHVVQVDRLLSQYQRIDAVLLLIGLNDFLRRLKQDEEYRPFLGVDRLDPQEYDDLMSQAFSVRPAADSSDPFYKPTEIWGRLRNVTNQYLRPLDPWVIQDEAGSVYKQWRSRRRAATSIRTTLPDLSSALDEYARNVGRIIEIAEAREVRVIFVTQPYMWRSGLSSKDKSLMWLGGVGNYKREAGHEYYSIKALAEGMEKYNDRLLRICQERNVECVDLESQLRKSQSVFYDEVHFNEAGAGRVAEVLGEHLSQGMPRRTLPLSGLMSPPRDRASTAGSLP
jgi:lysophospholipase L1-like esterase